MPRLSPTRVASTHVAAMPREACIVAAGRFGDSFCLFKNRDRNYLPKIKVVHEVRDGVEVAYMKDDKTGWIEGMNEHGVGIVNAALMVSRDESERDEVERTGKKLLDGDRILRALLERTVAAAAKNIRSYKDGLKGHSIVSDGKKTIYVEMPDSNDVEYDEVPTKKVFVRTNHGIEFPDAGYVEGPREESSKSRQEEAERVLSKVKSADDVAPAILRARTDRWEPTEMVRDSKSDRKMRTTTQMVLDLTKKKLTLYLLPERVKYLGLDDRLPKDFEPKITIEVVEYEDLKEETDAETEPVAKRKTASESLLPILDPAFNIREIFKQLVLLEDHLAQPRKRCVDCIWKHLLTAEALAEEGVTLDVERKHGAVLDGLAEKVRGLQRKVQDGQDMGDIASEARLLRKTLLGTASSVRVARAKFDHACDHKGISYGWISPYGRVYVMHGYGHEAWAKEYLQEHPSEMVGVVVDAYESEGVLLRKGWLQVTNATAVMAWNESSATSAAWEAMAEIVVGCVLGGRLDPEKDTVWVAFDRSSRRVTPADFVEEYGGRRLSEQMFEGLMAKRVASKHLTGASQVTVPDGMRIIDNAGYKDLTGIRRIPVARGSDGEVVVGNEAIDEAGARIPGKPYMTDVVMGKLFDGSPLVITEKVDGHPVILLYGGYTFFCEGLRVQHSVDYDNVPYSLEGWPDMAVVYDVLDGELEPPYSKGQGTGKWLTRSEQETLCSSVGAPIVPLVWEGHVDPEDLPKLADRISSFSGGSKAEGIVLKNYRTGVFGKFINLEFQSRLSDESLHPGGVHPMQRGVKNVRKWVT